jgi:hypothetical protein
VAFRAPAAQFHVRLQAIAAPRAEVIVRGLIALRPCMLPALN